MKILEEGIPLLESSLWRLQTNVFSKLGVEAWTKKGVPSYMTSNPFTARKYAHLVLGYLRDGLSENSKNPIDVNEPIYIFDLGAGTGRFSYVFLKQLQILTRELPFLQKVTLRYIMTDIVDSNIEFCKNHPYLKHLIENKVIDFAYYHHSQTEPLHLQLSGVTLNKAELKNPIILIGNYFFDTIPQDLFRFHQGKWEKGTVTIKGPEEGNVFDDPYSLEKLKIEFNYAPIDEKEDKECEFSDLKPLIEDYSTNLDGIPFTVPVGAFKAIHYFEELSKGRLMLIAGDQGYATIEQLKNSNEPRLAIHGSFSMAVNYHAIRYYFDHKKGKGYLSNLSDPLFQVFVGVLGGNQTDYPELSLAFHDNIEAFEPKDYWNLASLVQSEWINPSLDASLVVLKLGYWDPMNFYTFYSNIRDQLSTATLKQKNELRDAIHAIWENFYPIHPLEGEFIMNLGVLFFEMQRFAEALGFLQRSLQITGDNATTYTNMAACYLSLFNPEAAHKCFEKAKVLMDASAAKHKSHS